MTANDRDVMLGEAKILKPTQTKRKVETMDDVTNFPEQDTVDLAESRP